jgi:hypothetical protein
MLYYMGKIAVCGDGVDVTHLAVEMWPVSHGFHGVFRA